MDFFLMIPLAFAALLLFILGFTVTKIIVTKKLPDNLYTPFDYITGQTDVEFHEEKEARAEDDDQGEGKNKKTKT